MRVTALLCDFASVRENLLFVSAGGITRIWRSDYPAPMGVSLALMFEVHPMELPYPHEVAIRVMGPDGEELTTVQAGFTAGGDLQVGEELLVPMALDLRNVGLPREGAHSVEIAVDGTHQKTVQFWVQPRPQPEAT